MSFDSMLAANHHLLASFLDFHHHPLGLPLPSSYSLPPLLSVSHHPQRTQAAFVQPFRPFKQLCQPLLPSHRP
jgi:hypothetical protein